MLKTDRNQEGYHDPTAGEAIRKADRQHKRKRSNQLMYRIGDTKSFKTLFHI